MGHPSECLFGAVAKTAELRSADGRDARPHTIYPPIFPTTIPTTISPTRSLHNVCVAQLGTEVLY
jgi:hypothetical protein